MTDWSEWSRNNDWLETLRQAKKRRCWRGCALLLGAAEGVRRRGRGKGSGGLVRSAACFARARTGLYVSFFPFFLSLPPTHSHSHTHLLYPHALPVPLSRLFPLLPQKRTHTLVSGEKKVSRGSVCRSFSYPYCSSVCMYCAGREEREARAAGRVSAIRSLLGVQARLSNAETISNQRS
jgi:hypothetical protein